VQLNGRELASLMQSSSVPFSAQERRRGRKEGREEEREERKERKENQCE
jgi:hypothetical protein